MTTRGDFKSQLAMAMGDAQTTGTPNYAIGSGFKWSEPEYNSAIDFGMDFLKKMNLFPVHSVFTMTGGVSLYEYTVPGSLTVITEVVRETKAGSGQFEKIIPLHWVEIRRRGGTLMHFDKSAMDKSNMNISAAQVEVRGYRYPYKPTGDGSAVNINNAALLMVSKLFLHMGGSSRDPSELLKNMRQLEQAREIISDFEGEPIVERGIWIDPIE